MLNKLIKAFWGPKNPMKLDAWEIWKMGKTIMRFDFEVVDHSRIRSAGSLSLRYRGDWGRTPILEISSDGLKVFDVYHAGNEMHVNTFRRGNWLIEYEQLWRQAETKRRLKERIEYRGNFDPIGE